MNKPVWEEYVEAEKYDTTWDKSLQIPYKSETDWKEEIKTIIKKGCTDSDIEDYLSEHSELNGKEVWNYVYELDAPDGCKGCEFIQMNGMYPCNVCTRRNRLKDFYKRR